MNDLFDIIYYTMQIYFVYLTFLSGNTKTHSTIYGMINIPT